MADLSTDDPMQSLKRALKALNRRERACYILLGAEISKHLAAAQNKERPAGGSRVGIWRYAT